MINKAIKLLVFVIYSWLIYTTCFYMTFLFYVEGATIAIWPLIAGYYSFYYSYAAICVIIAAIAYSLIIVAILGGLALIPIVSWIRHQTIVRAWLLALSGALLGPGILLIIPNIYQGIAIEGIYGFLLVNILYVFLILGNIISKKYMPGNKVANKVRAILSWPCLKT